MRPHFRGASHDRASAQWAEEAQLLGSSGLPLKAEKLLDLGSSDSISRSIPSSATIARRSSSVHTILLGSEYSPWSRLRTRKGSVPGYNIWTVDEARTTDKRSSSLPPAIDSLTSVKRRKSTNALKDHFRPQYHRSGSVDLLAFHSNDHSSLGGSHLPSRTSHKMGLSRPLIVPGENHQEGVASSTMLRSPSTTDHKKLNRAASPAVKAEKKLKRLDIPSLSFFSQNKSTSTRSLTPGPFRSNTPSHNSSENYHDDAMSSSRQSDLSRSSGDLSKFTGPVGGGARQPVRYKPRDDDLSFRPKRQVRKLPRRGVRNWFDGIEISSDEDEHVPQHRLWKPPIATCELPGCETFSTTPEVSSRNRKQLKEKNSHESAKSLVQKHWGAVERSVSLERVKRTDRELRREASHDMLSPRKHERGRTGRTIGGLPPTEEDLPQDYSRSAGAHAARSQSALQRPGPGPISVPQTAAAERMTRSSSCGIDSFKFRQESTSSMITSGTIPIQLGSRVVTPRESANVGVEPDFATLRNDSITFGLGPAKPLPATPNEARSNAVSRMIPSDAAHMMAVTEEEMILLEAMRHRRTAKQLGHTGDPYQQLARRRESMLAKAARKSRASDSMSRPSSNSEVSGGDSELAEQKRLYRLLQQEDVDTDRKLERFFAQATSPSGSTFQELHSPSIPDSVPLESPMDDLVLQPTVYSPFRNGKQTKSIHRRNASNVELSPRSSGPGLTRSRSAKERNAKFVPVNLFDEEAIPDIPSSRPAVPDDSSNEVERTVERLPNRPISRIGKPAQSTRKLDLRPRTNSRRSCASLPENAKFHTQPELPKRSMSYPPVPSYPLKKTFADHALLQDEEHSNEDVACSLRSQSVSTLPDQSVKSIDYTGHNAHLSSGAFSEKHKSSSGNGAPGGSRGSIISINSTGEEILAAWADLGGGHLSMADF